MHDLFVVVAHQQSGDVMPARDDERVAFLPAQLGLIEAASYSHEAVVVDEGIQLPKWTVFVNTLLSANAIDLFRIRFSLNMTENSFLSLCNFLYGAQLFADVPAVAAGSFTIWCLAEGGGYMPEMGYCSQKGRPS
ncbi:hypothetical protein FKM82_024666 [Ascaphus truei]